MAQRRAVSVLLMRTRAHPRPGSPGRRPVPRVRRCRTLLGAFRPGSPVARRIAFQVRYVGGDARSSHIGRCAMMLRLYAVSLTLCLVAALPAEALGGQRIRLTRDAAEHTAERFSELYAPVTNPYGPVSVDCSRRVSLNVRRCRLIWPSRAGDGRVVLAAFETPSGKRFARVTYTFRGYYSDCPSLRTRGARGCVVGTRGRAKFKLRRGDTDRLPS